jgi:hypothetical protein
MVVGTLEKLSLKLFLAQFIITLWISQSPAQQASAQSQLYANELAAQERTFSAEAEKVGTRDAFLHFFAGECIGFYPAPQNARRYWQVHGPTRGVLSWSPTFVRVSASGELGFSTGPWEYRKAKDSAAIAFGYFGSIWRKNDDGTWNVILDIGGDIPGPLPGEEELNCSSLPTRIPCEGGTEKKLQDIEREYAERVSKVGIGSGLKEFCSADVRVYRDGTFPKIGGGTTEEIKTPAAACRFEPAGSGVSKAGDFGYVYGVVVSAVSDSSAFLHIWTRRDTWKLQADFLRGFNGK